MRIKITASVTQFIYHREHYLGTKREERVREMYALIVQLCWIESEISSKTTTTTTSKTPNWIQKKNYCFYVFPFPFRRGISINKPQRPRV